MKSLLTHALLTLLIVSGALILYDRARHAPPVRFGVVDVADIYRLKEAQFAAGIAKQGSAPDAALKVAETFSRDLAAALEALPQECGCLVLVRSAVGGGADVIDLTPALKQKVGL